jgi:hypothetical protein
MNPIPSRAERVKGTPRRRIVHRAATMVTTSVIGVSISSAFIVPIRGTTHSVRIVPRTKPTPNTSPKRWSYRGPRRQRSAGSPWAWTTRGPQGPVGSRQSLSRCGMGNVTCDHRSGDVTGDFCTKWNERESTWRKSWSCRSRGTSQSKS